MLGILTPIMAIMPTSLYLFYSDDVIVFLFLSACRRDGKGCSNGCFILGYRVYVNGSSQMSVDGPMSYETTIRCPPPDANHKLMVHVR